MTDKGIQTYYGIDTDNGGFCVVEIDPVSCILLRVRYYIIKKEAD
jgi:hypothetical protein